MGQRFALKRTLEEVTVPGKAEHGTTYRLDGKEISSETYARELRRRSVFTKEYAIAGVFDMLFLKHRGAFSAGEQCIQVVEQYGVIPSYKQAPTPMHAVWEDRKVG